MGKSKDLFTMIRELELWNIPKMLRDLDNAELFLSNKHEENLEEEQFEVIKGNYKTIISYKFNKEGYPVMRSHEVVKILNEQQEKLKELENQLNKAVFEQDYKKAAEIQEKIKEHKTN